MAGPRPAPRLYSPPNSGSTVHEQTARMVPETDAMPYATTLLAPAPSRRMTAPWLMKTAIAPAISSAGNRHETTCSRAYHCNSANASCREFPKRGASNGIQSAAMKAAISSKSVRPSLLHSNGIADLLSTSIEVAVGAPKLGALPRSVGELVETALDGGEVGRRGHALCKPIDRAARPVGKVRMQSVENAVSDPRVFDDIERPQRRQMARHLRLRDIERRRQLAHAKRGFA